MLYLVPTRLTSYKNRIFPTSKHQKYTWRHNNTSERRDNHIWHDLSKLFYLLMVQNQVAKRKLTFVRKVTRNSDEQISTKLIMVCYNNKWRVGGVIHSNKKILVQKIALVVTTLYWCGSLKFWEHLALDNRYWKYLIHVIVNSPTPTPLPPSSPNIKIAQPPSSLFHPILVNPRRPHL